VREDQSRKLKARHASVEEQETKVASEEAAVEAKIDALTKQVHVMPDGPEKDQIHADEVREQRRLEQLHGADLDLAQEEKRLELELGGLDRERTKHLQEDARELDMARQMKVKEARHHAENERLAEAQHLQPEQNMVRSPVCLNLNALPRD